MLHVLSHVRYMVRWASGCPHGGRVSASSPAYNQLLHRLLYSHQRCDSVQTRKSPLLAHQYHTHELKTPHSLAARQ
jgi:hypothetical protein